MVIACYYHDYVNLILFQCYHCDQVKMEMQNEKSKKISKCTEETEQTGETEESDNYEELSIDDAVNVFLGFLPSEDDLNNSQMKALDFLSNFPYFYRDAHSYSHVAVSTVLYLGKIATETIMPLYIILPDPLKTSFNDYTSSIRSNPEDVDFLSNLERARLALNTIKKHIEDNELSENKSPNSMNEPRLNPVSAGDATETMTGVTLLDAALLLNDGIKEDARKTADEWRIKNHTLRILKPVGFSELHKQRPIYKPDDVYNYLKKINEPGLKFSRREFITKLASQAQSVRTD